MEKLAFFKLADMLLLEGVIMLFRRISEHVKDQNWFAVFLDFLIVVIGVFIGIQLGNWNDMRVENAREMAAIRMLQSETQENIRLLSRQSLWRSEQNAREIALSRALHQADTSFIQSPDAIDGIKEIMYFSRLGYENSVYDALSKSGDIALIDDLNILSALNGYHRGRQWTDLQYSTFREALSSMGPRWHHHVYHYTSDNPRQTAIQVDWDAFASDRQAKSGFAEATRIKTIYIGYIPGLIGQAEELCESLSARTGDPCDSDTE